MGHETEAPARPADDALQYAPAGRARARGTLPQPEVPVSVRLEVDAYSADVEVPWFAPRMVCTSCGMIGADAPYLVITPPSPIRTKGAQDVGLARSGLVRSSIVASMA